MLKYLQHSSSANQFLSNVAFFVFSRFDLNVFISLREACFQKTSKYDEHDLFNSKLFNKLNVHHITLSMQCSVNIMFVCRHGLAAFPETALINN